MTSTDLALPSTTGITIAATGLTIVDDLDFDVWAEYSEALARVEGALTWALGDWVVFGHDHYGEARTNKVAEHCGLSEKTVRNAASVCRRVPIDRRRPELSFGHHEAVAAKAPVEQDAWLQLAVDEGLSVYGLRDRISADRGLPSGGPDIGTRPRRRTVRFTVTTPVAIPDDVLDEGEFVAAQAFHDFLAGKGYETEIGNQL